MMRVILKQTESLFLAMTKGKKWETGDQSVGIFNCIYFISK